eukprot:CAMPEP_0202689772 /NCGR_PEP_ID=MMETSP1385-20130828/4960_1 /ASSEMBLY_ACC=CAM_ASM_000861 /TAXON_ID=933848 /ORGANISM="Elphidium margaritaceum" /LENGTH=260 /DNA_ID=CAMNT_0049344957 /DNA_START=23 /DNA_END=805 /DNA_ORIENTATION=+
MAATTTFFVVLILSAICGSISALDKPSSVPFVSKVAAQQWVDEWSEEGNSYWQGKVEWTSIWEVIGDETTEFVVDGTVLNYRVGKARADLIRRKIDSFNSGVCSVQTEDAAFPTSELLVSCLTDLDFQIAGFGVKSVSIESVDKLYFGDDGTVIRYEMIANNGLFGQILSAVITASTPSQGNKQGVVGADYVFKIGKIEVDQFDALLLCILSIITVAVMVVIYMACKMVRRFNAVYGPSKSSKKKYQYARVHKLDSEMSS